MLQCHRESATMIQAAYPRSIINEPGLATVDLSGIAGLMFLGCEGTAASLSRRLVLFACGFRLCRCAWVARWKC